MAEDERTKNSNLYTHMLPNLTRSDAERFKGYLEEYRYQYEALNEIIIDQSNMSSAKGGYYNQIQNNMRSFDIFGNRLMNSTSELAGYTFITRPKLCLATQMINQDPFLILFDTKRNNKSLNFAIRMLLDTKLSKSDVFRDTVATCPFFNVENPFLVPVCNNITDITGFPDPTMDIYTSEGGFFNEDISFAIGSDETRKTFEIQMTIEDIQGGVLMALFQVWFTWISQMANGTMIPYMEDILARRLPYTVSIYRFMLDPSRRVITRWAKATGCFPRAVPVGAVFNKTSGEPFVSSAAKFTVPFVCNVFEANKISIIEDFNALMRKYCPSIAQNYPVDDEGFILPSTSGQYELGGFVHQNKPIADKNFLGLPYIVNSGFGMQMKWRYRPEEDPNYKPDDLKALAKDVGDKSKQLRNINNAVNMRVLQEFANGNVYAI